MKKFFQRPIPLGIGKSLIFVIDCSFFSIVNHLRIKHHEDRAPLGVELLRVLHLLVGRALRVQFRLTVEQFLGQQGKNTLKTHSRPEVPLTISSIVVSLYIPMGQLYFGVFTYNNNKYYSRRCLKPRHQQTFLYRGKDDKLDQCSFVFVNRFDV